MLQAPAFVVVDVRSLDAALARLLGRLLGGIYVSLSLSIYIYIYICVNIYIYIYTW